MNTALPLHHVGRALAHLNQRRGFKANRKTDDPGERGKIASASARLEIKMAGFETPGAFSGRAASHLQQIGHNNSLKIAALLTILPSRRPVRLHPG